MKQKELIMQLERQHTVIEPNQDVKVELFRPGDGLGVSLAYYEIYGNAFPIEHVYDPDEVERRNIGDNQHTVVARTSNGEIVGMAGLFCHAPNKKVYEAGQLLVLKSYRKSSVAQEISQLIFGDVQEKLGIQIIFVEAVCNHTISQKLGYDQGLVPTGVEFECMPSNAYSKEGKQESNISLLLMFRVFRDYAHGVHLPKPYMNFMMKLYKELELERQINEGKNFTGETEWDEFLLPDVGLGRITIKKPGNDFDQVIKAFEVRVGKRALFQVYLNLGDGAAPEAVSFLQKRRYFFGGILPFWFKTDGLVMQKTQQEPMWDELKLFNKQAQEMVNFCRQDYGSTI